MSNPNLNTKYVQQFDLQRRVVSHMTSSSWQNVPHVSYIYEPDITEFYAEFHKLSERWSKEGSKITLNTVILKAITEGLLKAPELNAHIEYNHKKSMGKLRVLESINITLPWMLNDGRMITPAINDAEKLSLKGISDYIFSLSRRIEKTDINEMFYGAVVNDTLKELKKFNLSIIRRILASKLSKNRVKSLHGNEKEIYYNIPEGDRLTYKDLVNGTVTVSNIGSLYKEQKGFFALLEIIPPQVFAIGVGSAQERAGVFKNQNGEKEISIRKILPMCLAFDHRAVDFNSIVPFIKKLDEIFANPEIIHKW